LIHTLPAVAIFAAKLKANNKDGVVRERELLDRIVERRDFGFEV